MSAYDPKRTFIGYAVAQGCMKKKSIPYKFAREQKIMAVVMTNAVIQAEDVNNFFVKFSDDPVTLSAYRMSAG